MKYFKDFKKLCTPASVYLFINVIIFISIAIQNFGNTTQYCVGQYKCHVPNTFSMFLFKALYMLFWTFILNAICKAGYKEVSWFMVLLPIILLFIIIGIVILNSGSVSIYEGFKEGNIHDRDNHQKEKKHNEHNSEKKNKDHTHHEENIHHHHEDNKTGHHRKRDNKRDNKRDHNKDTKDDSMTGSDEENMDTTTTTM